MKKLLNSKGIKATNQRIEVLDVINKNGPITIKDLCELLPHIDKSTIYRIINLLENKDIIIKNFMNKRIAYEIHLEHKHYLKCIKCNKKIEIDHCPFQDEFDGFKIMNHIINIEGICNNCQKK